MFKLKIMIPVSLTGFTGYFLFNPSFTSSLLLVTCGILLMAIAASVLNQIQEIDTDSRMERTRNRPLPSGKVRPANAFIVFLIFTCTGSFLIFRGGNTSAVLLSLFTVAWYNGVYTLLKRVTAYAVIPGALTGAMPPLIGWLAAGGSPADIRIVIIMIMFFAGQMPHFWLLLMKYGDQYSAAGMPSITSQVGENLLKKLILGFVVLTSFTALFLKVTGIVGSNIIYSSIIIISVALIVTFFIFLEDRNAKMKVRKYSIFLNSYYLLVMILLFSDRFLSLF